MFGYSQGGQISVAYATSYPRRVSHLILYGTYARSGAAIPGEIETAFNLLIKSDWEMSSKLLADMLIPDAELSVRQWFSQNMREAFDSDLAVRFYEMNFRLDVTDLLPKVRVPTLVMHRQGDRLIPLRIGREIAAPIPGARFVQLEGNIHLLMMGDVDPMLRAIAEFLGDGVSKLGETHVTQDLKQTKEKVAATEAGALIAGLDEVVLSRYRIVGNYTRYDEAVRNTLKDARVRIAAGCLQPSRKRENHLIWAAPGSGKTYFAQQIAASLPGTIRYHELNLAKCSEEEFRAGLSALDCKDGPCFCLIDECDAKPQEPWPYEILLPYLDASVERGTPLVFVLAGSGGGNLAEIKKRMAARPKGPDLLSRIPAGNEYEIMPLGIGDRILVVLSQFREVGKEFNREINSVEKLGLYYVALNPRLANARQLREFAVRAIERVPSNDDRVKYDHLFSAGDPENKAFWLQTQAAAAGLVNSFAMLKD